MVPALESLPRNTLLCLWLCACLVMPDNLELLSATLRAFQSPSCHGEPLTLRCPQGTSISVQTAQYRRPSSTWCAETPLADNNTCLWSSALQTVVEACQKKKQCMVLPSPVTVEACPGSHQPFEVTFKCRPYEFRSKVSCENDVVQLSCGANTRLVVYSASFGRTEYESLKCPQTPGAPEETCLVSHAIETVMAACHGKRRCTITADSATFGSPCRPQTRTYLKVVYTCVPRLVLRVGLGSPLEEDEVSDAAPDGGRDYEDAEAALAAFSPAPTPPPATAATLPPPPGPTGGKLDKLYLYLIVAAAALLLVVLGAAAGHRFLLRPRRARRRAAELLDAKAAASRAFSAVDLTSPPPPPPPPPPPEVVRTGSRRGVAASAAYIASGGGASLPRSLARGGDARFYYG